MSLLLLFGGQGVTTPQPLYTRSTTGGPPTLQTSGGNPTISTSGGTPGLSTKGPTG